MRDHRSLLAFQRADALVLETFRLTEDFPRREVFGLAVQMRRAAISVASNIVEGCARPSQRELEHFIDIANASAKELAYQLSVAERLDFCRHSPTGANALCDETIRMLNGLRRAIARRRSGSRL